VFSVDCYEIPDRIRTAVYATGPLGTLRQLPATAA
jgi:hypothetical protein